MFIRLAPVTVLAVGFLFLAGCTAKLNQSKSYSVQPDAAQGFYLPAQPKPQKINIDFKADNDVTVLLFKADDAKTDDEAILKPEKQALGFQKGKSGTFSVDVPENTETRLVIRGAQKTTKVDVKVTN